MTLSGRYGLDSHNPNRSGILGILLPDDDGDVVEAPRQLRRERVERATDVLLELHQPGLSGRRTANALTSATPNRNPPTCAKNATPPPLSGCVIAVPPDQSWNTNQKPRKKSAGIGRRKKPDERQDARALGRSTRYAPRTPAIAPLAPTFGTLASAIEL